MADLVESEPAPARGRPRDASLDEAILSATHALVGEVGYGRLSIDMVARRAGVTRPTIYLRWRNKPELVHAALFRRRGGLPNTGRLHHDFSTVADRAIEAWERPGVRAALLGLLADAAIDDALHATVMASIAGPIRGWLTAVLDAAVERGEVRADVRPDDVYDLFMGPLFQHYVCNGRTDRGFCRVVVDQVTSAISR